MIEIILSNVTKVFERHAGTHTALRDVSLTVAAGEFLCLIGPSGSGKTTLLRCIAGLEQPTSGSLAFVPAGPPPRIGMVFQEHALLPWLSLCENVALPLYHRVSSSSQARFKAKAMLERVGLDSVGERLPHEVSGGMRQRASVARAFAVDPPILLMDEPFIFVDYPTRLGLYALLTDLLKQTTRTVVFVTHDIPEAVLLADRVVVLSERPGRIVHHCPINLPHPRDPVGIHADSRYAAYVAQLHTYLQIGTEPA